MKKRVLNKESLMEKYSDTVLSSGKKPENVFVFAKNNGFTEAEFYQYFASFETLEAAYLTYFFEKSVELVHQIENYNALSAKEQLLNFYFIMFENFNMNRSLLLYLLPQKDLHNMKKLQAFKAMHKAFVQNLAISTWEWMDKVPKSIKSFQNKSKEELLWLHFLSILQFWMKDQSAGFEKTTLYIEKTIDTGFDLVENPLMNKLIDLGKFMWKEQTKPA